MRRRALVLLAGTLVCALGACAGGRDRGPPVGRARPESTHRQVYEALAPDDGPEDVRRKWGEPTRILTYKDEGTGSEEQVWQYEPPAWIFDDVVPVSAPITTQRITFRQGRIYRVEQREQDPRPREVFRPDSASRRDMQ